MGQHAELPASAAEQWMRCPGSIKLKEQLIKDGNISEKEISSEYAMEGTAAHYVLASAIEQILLGEYNVTADIYKGMAVIVSPEDVFEPYFIPLSNGVCPKNCFLFSVDEDMIWAVNIALNYIREVLTSYGWSSDTSIPSNIILESEVKVDLSHFEKGEKTGGTCDIRITIFLEAIHIIDFKYGRGIPVHPEYNAQLMIYAQGDNVMEEQGVEKAFLTIIQPRCYEVENIATWETTAEELRQWGKEVITPTINDVFSDDPPLIAGEEQCRWCSCAGFCQKQKEKALQDAGEAFSEIPDILEKEIIIIPSEKEVQKKIITRSPEELAKFLQVIPFLDQLIKTTFARATALAISGTEIPGYKLVTGRKGNRKWIPDAEEQLAKKRIPKRISHETKLKSPAQFLKTKEGKQYSQIVEDLIERADGKAELVPESDKRPAIPPPAIEDFDDLA